MMRVILKAIFVLLCIPVLLSNGAKAAEPEGALDFTLTSQGAPWQFSSLRGQAVMVFFGYTNCPDICPTTASLIARALDKLPNAAKGKVVGLFITLDPKRDLPEVIVPYAKAFHPDLLAKSGTDEETRAVADLFGVDFQLRTDIDPENYGVDHSPLLFLIDPEGHQKHAFIAQITPVDALAMLAAELVGVK